MDVNTDSLQGKMGELVQVKKDVRFLPSSVSQFGWLRDHKTTLAQLQNSAWHKTDQSCPIRS
jgi:hypothetical protein